MELMAIWARCKGNIGGKLVRQFKWFGRGKTQITGGVFQGSLYRDRDWRQLADKQLTPKQLPRPQRRENNTHTYLSNLSISDKRIFWAVWITQSSLLIKSQSWTRELGWAHAFPVGSLVSNPASVWSLHGLPPLSALSPNNATAPSFIKVYQFQACCDNLINNIPFLKQWVTWPEIFSLPLNLISEGDKFWCRVNANGPLRL